MNDKQTIQSNISDTSGEIVMYQPDETIRLEVRLGEDTVWLSQQQIAMLFGVKQPAISKHLNNIFRSGELNEASVHSILEYTASDGKRYQTKFYNLDAILSVGYRVNSINATLFRQWANKVLKDYLLKGYSATALRNMRKFYENRSALDCNSASTLADISSVATDETKTTIAIAEINSEKSFAVTSALQCSRSISAALCRTHTYTTAYGLGNGFFS